MQEGRTGVIIPVPSADPLLATLAQRHPGAVREGVPAHVSVLYPFVPAAELDADAERELADIAEATPATEVTFGRCRRIGDFVYSPPDPPADLNRLIAAVRGHWPDVLPYGGAVEDVGPHLTVAMRTGEQTAAVIEHEVADELPIAAQLREMWLVVFADGWRVRRRFSFAAAR